MTVTWQSPLLTSAVHQGSLRPYLTLTMPRFCDTPMKSQCGHLSSIFKARSIFTTALVLQGEENHVRYALNASEEGPREMEGLPSTPWRLCFPAKAEAHSSYIPLQSCILLCEKCAAKAESLPSLARSVTITYLRIGDGWSWRQCVSLVSVYRPKEFWSLYPLNPHSRF